MPRFALSTAGHQLQASLLPLFKVAAEIPFPTPNRRHKTDPVPLLNDASPSFKFNEPPIREIDHLISLRILFRWKEKELHSFLDDPDLRHSSHLFVIENATTQRTKLGELFRNVIMLESMFHEKQIAQCSGIRLKRIE